MAKVLLRVFCQDLLIHAVFFRLCIHLQLTMLIPVLLQVSYMYFLDWLNKSIWWAEPPRMKIRRSENISFCGHVNMVSTVCINTYEYIVGVWSTEIVFGGFLLFSVSCGPYSPWTPVVHCIGLYLLPIFKINQRTLLFCLTFGSLLKLTLSKLIICFISLYITYIKSILITLFFLIFTLLLLYYFYLCFLSWEMTFDTSK